MADVRRYAYEVIYRVLYEDAYSAILLNRTVKEHDLKPLDASFLSALVYGVLERKLTLEYIIRRYSSVRLKKIEKKTLIILYLGVYQLIWMDKVPDSAAVNESVKLCKSLRLFQSAGFVNALLRSLIRANKEYKLPAETDRTMYLSVRYSCPEAIVAMWREKFGDALTERMLNGILGRPPITVRVNTLKTTRDGLKAMLAEQGVEAEEVPFLDHALHLNRTGSIESIPAFQEGLFYVEDAASQLCAEILGAHPGETVCDVCAAPGGKSFCSAIRMENRGEVYSYDLHEHKLKLIRSGAKRLGITILHTALRDASDAGALLPLCDRILCDVPCSGLGILRRKPEIRYKTDTNIDILSKLQYSILCTSADMLPNGGILVYSTCTLDDRENGEIVSRFLDVHPEYAPESIRLPSGIEHMIEEPANCLTILPGIYGTDGFFISLFRKVGHDG